MEILIRRVAKKDTYTIGKLYVNGSYFCDTIEDTDRGLTQTMPVTEITKKKVYAETAIPSGTYGVTLAYKSPSFGKKQAYAFCGGFLPRLLNVPGYEGVLIHCGNTEKDSAGCIIVGENKVVGKVINSQATFKRLYAVLKTAKNINLTIK